jgi:hypothetical protein
VISFREHASGDLVTRRTAHPQIRREHARALTNIVQPSGSASQIAPTEATGKLTGQFPGVF